MPGSIQQDGDKAPAPLDNRHAPCSIASAKINNRRRNMTEDEQKKIEASLHEEIDLLKFALSLVLATLPENHRDYILARVAERARLTREMADAKGTDPFRDQAETAYDFEQYVINRLDEETDIFADRSQFYGIP